MQGVIDNSVETRDDVVTQKGESNSEGINNGEKLFPGNLVGYMSRYVTVGVFVHASVLI